MYIAKNLDPELEESLQTTWNAKVVEYDNDRFPFSKWMLGRIQKMGYTKLDDLTEIHNVVPDKEVFRVTKQLCADTNLPEFRRMVNNFVREVAVVKGKLKTPVGVQRFLNVRIMLPNKPEGIFPFHTGLLYGHGPASRSLWMPMTDVRADEMRNASMQILDINESRRLIQQAVDQRLGIDQMTELFRDKSWQCKVGPGSLIFFTQENIHGNFVNDTGKTRVSIDFRVAEARHSDQLCRKIAGGYFEIIPDTDAAEDWQPHDPSRFNNGKRNLAYLNNATSATFGTPVHLQRYMVLEYLKNNNLVSEFELFELEDLSHLPTLNYIVGTLKSNPVMYSVFALPEDRGFRKKILDIALANGLIIHFVNENMSIVNEKDREKIEKLLSFAKFGQTAIGLPSETTIDVRGVTKVDRKSVV